VLDKWKDNIKELALENLKNGKYSLYKLYTVCIGENSHLSLGTYRSITRSGVEMLTQSMTRNGIVWVSKIDPMTVILEEDKSYTILEGNHRHHTLLKL